VRDIEIIKRELPIDLLEFFYLTPLPGSADHKALWDKGAWMDPDMNKYDLNHVTTAHPRMSEAELRRAYRLAWKTYFTIEHIETVMRRAVARRISAGRIMFLMLWFYGCITFEKLHPLEGGYLRRKYRRDRRPGLPIESPLVFYPRYAGETLYKHARLFHLVWRLAKIRRRLKRDPEARSYTDLALRPVREEELDELGIFTASAAAKSAVDRARRQRQAAKAL